MSKSDLEKIMYIEDEPDITAIAKIALEDMGGFTLNCCSSGYEAVRQAPGFKPDLFLIDVMMPEMDGISTLKELRKIPEFSSTPIIFMTAKAQTTEIKEYIEVGALSVITKPFDPMKLAETIQTIWDSRNG